ncbi:MAG: cytidine deaminase [Thermomicrobiales bacterium]
MPASITAEVAESLLASARQAAENAYVPYSRFPVGAAVLTSDGSIVTGANVENASYPLSVCAERVTLGTAAAAGHRHIRAIAVTAPRVAVVTPCGGCRQVINEFRMPDGTVDVILEGEHGPEILSLDDLLPRAFGPRDLE